MNDIKYSPDVQLLTPGQVATYMGVDKQMILARIHDKTLRAFKLGPHTYRIHPDDLREYLERSEAYRNT